MMAHPTTVIASTLYSLAYAGVVIALAVFYITLKVSIHTHAWRVVIARLIKIIFGYWLAIIIASFIFYFTLRISIDDYSLIILDSIQIGGLVLIFPLACVLVVSFEILKIRSLRSYLIATNIFSLILFLATTILHTTAPSGLTAATFSRHNVSAFEALETIGLIDVMLIPLMGFSTGFIYWAVAGRSSGNWRATKRNHAIANQGQKF